MSVSRSPAPSSIDLSGVPARVAEAVAQVVAVCHEQFRSDPCPEAFEEAELRVRETMNALACELLGAVIEKRDDGASRIERDGQSWFRVAATPRTIMTSLGPLTYRRARYRSGASGSSPVPVDESLGLVDDYLTRPAAQLGLLMMGHCTAREAAAFFAKIGGMTPSVSTLQRLTRTMHERWESLGPETLDSIRDAEGVPHEAVSASVSLDGVMVPLRAGEDGRAEASWREAACGTVSFHDARGERLKGSVASLAKGRCVIRGLPVHLMILRWPDGPVAMPWPRSGRTVRDRRRARRSGPRRQCRPGGRTSRPGPCAARASPRSP